MEEIQSRHIQIKEQLLVSELEQKELENELEDLQHKQRQVDTELVYSELQGFEAALQRKMEEVEYLRASISDMEKTHLVMKHEDYYTMNKNPHGLCVIFNNHKFYSETDPNEGGERRGSEIDQYNLTQTFRYLRYKVLVQENITADQMLATMMQVSEQDHSNHDSFVCCILSHTSHDFVYGADSVALELNRLTGVIRNCRSLFNKPKLFFIQGCRSHEQAPPGLKRSLSTDEDIGFEPDTEGESVNAIPSKVPRNADFFFGFATPAGKAAYRSKKHGSWFISELCKELVDCGYHDSLSTMMKRVNRKLSRAFTKEGHKQCAEFVDRLRQEVHFFYYIKKRQT